MCYIQKLYIHMLSYTHSYFNFIFIVFFIRVTLTLISSKLLAREGQAAFFSLKHRVKTFIASLEVNLGLNYASTVCSD